MRGSVFQTEKTASYRVTKLRTLQTQVSQILKRVPLDSGFATLCARTLNAMPRLADRPGMGGMCICGKALPRVYWIKGEIWETFLRSHKIQSNLSNWVLDKSPYLSKPEFPLSCKMDHRDVCPPLPASGGAKGPPGLTGWPGVSEHTVPAVTCHLCPEARGLSSRR